MSASQEKTVVYLLGDSITQGLGSKKINFSDELIRRLGDDYEVINLACTGTMITYALELNAKGLISAQGCSKVICVVLYGNVDAQIRPSTKGKVFSKIPKRYQKNGMLMPRPFYSKAVHKRMWQHVDNLNRRMWGWLIRKVDGVEQWVSIGEFLSKYKFLLEKLEERGISPITCSCVYIDEGLFPGCQEQFCKFNQGIQSLARDCKAQYIDFYGLLESLVDGSGWDAYYNADHFHPNGGGYTLMAEVIASAIKREGD